MIKPAYEKFKRYCISKNYGTDEYIKSLYDYLDERKWKKANGEEPVNWMILTDANFGVFNAKGKFSRAIREKMAEKSDDFDPVEPFPDNGMNYVAYTDGSCDNHSKYKAGGSAYVVLKDGDIVKMKNHGRLQTTNNRMELLAIISAAKSCPDGAYLVDLNKVWHQAKDVMPPSIYGGNHGDLLCVHQFKPNSHPHLTHEENCPEFEEYLKASPNDWWCRTGDLLKMEHRELYWR